MIASRFAAAATVLVSVVCAAQAANINIGNHVLLANTPNQVVTIQVTGGEQIAGEDFFAQIGDGGTFNGGSNAKPVFTNVDIIQGAIFDANNNGAYGDPNGIPPGSNASHPLIWLDGTTTNNGSVTANGLLATLTIDTTGLASGTFLLRLTGVASSLGSFNTTLRNTNGDPIPLAVSDGSFVISPAPYGDYNNNGVVDAADYTLFRKNLGQALSLPNEDPSVSPGEVTIEDYQVWRAHFGQTVSTGGLQTTSVPEPNSIVLMLLFFVAFFARSRLGIHRAR